MKKVLIVPFHIHRNIVDAEYLSEGILEEFIDLLSEMKTLSVVGRNLSLYLKENPKPGRELAREFSIDYLVEGNIKIHEGQPQLTVRLVNALDEQVITMSKSPFHIDDWTSSLRKLGTEVLSEEVPSIKSMSTLGPKKNVRELYLKGLYHWNRYSHEEMHNAISYFQRAIKLDPNYAPAYAGIANCYTVIAYGGYEAPLPAYAKANQYVNKALLLNDKHSESYLCAALINLFYHKNYKKVKSNLDFALGLNRNNPIVHHLLSFYYATTREFDLAEKHCLQGIKLDPLAVPQYAMLIRLSIFKKDFAKADEVLEGALTIEQDSLPILALKAQICLLLGNIESAIATFKECLLRSKKDLHLYGLLSFAYSRSNFEKESNAVEQALEDTSESKDTGNYDYAKAIIKLGRKDYDGFFHHVNKALDLGISSPVGQIYLNPLFSEIRKDKRYDEFLKRNNLDTIVATSSQKRMPSASLAIQTNTKEQFVIDPQDIAFIRGEGNYSTIYYYEKSVLQQSVLRVTLKNLEDQLRPYAYICRVHKSYMINLHQELSLTGNAKGYFLESTYLPVRIPISRSKSEAVKSQIALLG